MEIVKLPPERWAEYKAIRLEALRTDPDAFGAKYETSLLRPDEWWIGHLQTAQIDPNKTVVFAVEDGRILGMAGAYPESDPANVNIVGMYVTPSGRGRGIGRALLQAVVDEVTASEVRLCVMGDQPAAVGLYRSFGFVTIDDTLVEGRSQLYMALRSGD